MEQQFYQDIATIYLADLGPPIAGYAVITAAIRYHLAGVSKEFIMQTIDDIDEADILERLESNAPKL